MICGRALVRGIALNASVAVKVQGTGKPAGKGIRAKKRVPVEAFGSVSKVGKCR